MSKKVERTTIVTVSLPQDIIDYLRKKSNYSGYIASLVRTDMEKAVTATSISTVTPEEVEIRQALEQRETLPNRFVSVGQIEFMIKKGKSFNELYEGHDIPVGWKSEVRLGEAYYRTYEKYQRDDNLRQLWCKVETRVNDEKKQKRELYLQQELVPGITRKQILDKIEKEWFGTTTGTISEVVEVLCLPYPQIYNKVLPFLRTEGYEITPGK